VKLLGIIGFAICSVLFVGILALGIYATVHDENQDSPAIAARKAECQKLEAHVFSIMPASQLEGLSEEERQKKLDELVAKLPIEDIEQCAAADKDKTGADRKAGVLDCMKAARDEAGLKQCIPKPQT
jgi:hypothetical protein